MLPGLGSFANLNEVGQSVKSPLWPLQADWHLCGSPVPEKLLTPAFLPPYFKVTASELGLLCPSGIRTIIMSPMVYLALSYLMRQFSEGGVSPLVRAHWPGILIVSIDWWNGSVQTLTILFLKREIFLSFFKERKPLVICQLIADPHIT